jgi:hypothetical protein
MREKQQKQRLLAKGKGKNVKKMKEEKRRI